MTKLIIQVPTIRANDNGYNRILKIAKLVFDNPKQHFDFDFSQCARLDHNAVVVLGGLARYVNYHNSIPEKIIAGLLSTDAFITAGVMFRVDTMSTVVVKHLIGNNFLGYFSSGKHAGYPKVDYIGYREHNNLLDADKIASHLEDQWLTGDKLKLSPLLKPAIISRIFEIFMNAYGHGVFVQDIEKLGVYSCGQHDPKEKKLYITVLDFGPGIVENVKAKGITNDSVEAMHWALQKGNSTRTDSEGIEMPRGLGLDLLHEFVLLNEGELRIFSNDVKVKISKEVGVLVENSGLDVRGTLVSVTVNCDDREYLFLSERNSNQEQYF